MDYQLENTKKKKQLNNNTRAFKSSNLSIKTNQLIVNIYL